MFIILWNIAVEIYPLLSSCVFIAPVTVLGYIIANIV